MTTKDYEVREILEDERKRQASTIELIASENFVSQEVLRMCGSEFMNKYAEGYPNARYYDGCENVDKLEQLAIDRLKELFNVRYANVQPHSGSQANAAVYNALLKPGDKILGMSLNSGGHLTHGSRVSFSGQVYDAHFYDVDKQTETLNMDDIEKIAIKTKPKLIIAGASSYSRIIDFKRFGEIAKKVNAYLMVDMAHIAGLIVAGCHPSPVDYADAITSTTHKTLRGARGGIIITNNREVAEKINSSVFPGIQGGPLMNIIAGKAVAFKEAQQQEYKNYMKSVVINASKMAESFMELGRKIVSNGTDNHLFMIDTIKSYNISGKEAATKLNEVGIIVNKNSIPYDNLGPNIASGIRIGTAAMTTHGYDYKWFAKLAKLIDKILSSKETNTNQIKNEVSNLLGEREK